MMIIFHFYFLLNFILNAKKSLIKLPPTQLDKKIRTNQIRLKRFYSVRIIYPNYEVLRVQHLKICTTKQTYRQTMFFERWRAYLKRWSVISSLSLIDRERTAYCRKKLYDNKTLNKPFCFPLQKTTSGKRKKLSYKRATAHLQSLPMLADLTKGQKPLNYIYPHKA